GVRREAGAGAGRADPGPGELDRGGAGDLGREALRDRGRQLQRAVRGPVRLAGAAGAFAQLRENFDFVIVDLPPVNVYGDALIVGPQLDAAIIVIEADATRVPDIERARRTLERCGVRFVGSVLNRQRNYIPAFIEEML